jgi:hypothetical protein
VAFGRVNALMPDGRIKKASLTPVKRTWQCISLEVSVKRLKILYTHYIEQMGLTTCCGMIMKRLKMVGVSVRKMRI